MNTDVQSPTKLLELGGWLVMVVGSHTKLLHMSLGPTLQPVLMQIPARA